MSFDIEPDHDEHALCRQEIHDLNMEIGRLRGRLRGADRLAYQCAQAIARRAIGTRTKISDTVEDYMNIGSIGGPQTVPDWITEYEAAEATNPIAEAEGGG